MNCVRQPHRPVAAWPIKKPSTGQFDTRLMKTITMIKMITMITLTTMITMITWEPAAELRQAAIDQTT